MAALPVHAVDQLHALVAVLHALSFRDGSPHRIIPSLLLGAQRSHAALFAAMDTALKNHLTALCKMSGKALADQRYKKFRQIGEAKRA